MTPPHIAHLTLHAIKAAIKAGLQVMEIYGSDFSITFKEDQSPLTRADLAAHEVIATLLSDTDFPLLSEEGRNIPWEIRRSWHYFWMVDPLDGTKEFISRNGEFTVNIALIAGNSPVLGVIYVPVSGMLYFGNQQTGSWRADCSGNKTILDATSLDQICLKGYKLPEVVEARPIKILASRSHLTSDTSNIINRIMKEFPDCETSNTGSSLKFCKLAEGNSHYYPRFSPTMEWDTAAGHAIAKYAGIEVITWPFKQDLKYNKESLVNPWFLAFKRGLPDFTDNQEF